MSLFRLIVASFTHHGRMNLAVACGVAAGTAVLSGALLVGDSMRGSLRRLTFDRLGPIDEVLLPDRFFREKLADELAGQPEFRQRFRAAVPVILVRGTLEWTPQPEELGQTVEITSTLAGGKARRIDFAALDVPTKGGRLMVKAIGNLQGDSRFLTIRSERFLPEAGDDSASDSFFEAKAFAEQGRDDVELTAEIPLPETAWETMSRDGTLTFTIAVSPAVDAVSGLTLRLIPELGPDLRVAANRVNVLGCDGRFWRLGLNQAEQPTGRREIALNEPLAERLGVRVGKRLVGPRAGDEVMLRLSRETAIPAEGLLGREDETARSLRMDVTATVPAKGLGRFSVRPSQQVPLNAFVSLGVLQRGLEQPNRVNALLVAGKTGEAEPLPESHEALQRLLKPGLADYGIRLEKTERGDLSYFNVTSERMLFPSVEEAEVVRALKTEDFQPVFTYLANHIDTKKPESGVEGRRGRRSGIPYSTITAVDFVGEPPLGPFLTPEGNVIAPLQDAKDGKPGIVLSQWAADDLNASAGQTIYLSYFEPESAHGRLRERTVVLQLAAVAQMAGAADDRALTPNVAGVTDKLSMAQWNPPFPFDPKRIRQKDEQYWETRGPTPKAFLSLKTGRQLWRSRFGQTTSIRVAPRAGMTEEGLKRKLALDPASMGFVFQPVKTQGLAASAGTTPFNVLFLAFSLFIIAAAVMLVALLFRLGIERRAAELGTLLAVGFTRRRIALLLLGEGLVTAMLGGLLGVPAGVGYAALMLLGLRTWWLAAVVTPFLRLHVTPTSLLIGSASGVVVALLAIVWALWRTRRVAPRQLLTGQASGEGRLPGSRPRYAGKLGMVLLIAAVGLGLLAARLDEEIQAGAFFGAGAMVLVASLTWVWVRLRAAATSSAVSFRGVGHRLGVRIGLAAVCTFHLHLLRLALRNAARNPGRSTLTVGLVAAACFLIVAVSAFRLDPTQQVPTFHSGNGGFALAAESDLPVYHDLNTAAGRSALGFSDEDSQLLAEAGAATISLRVKPGDDASCLNLYRPRRPRVLGVPQRLIKRGGFAWAGSVTSTPAQPENPWLLLGEGPDPTAPIPVVVDKNTAAYSLHVGLGDIYEITDDRGQTIRLRVVGLLPGSIFQGDLLISEAAFLRLFPETSGYQCFLTEFREETTPAQIAAVANALRRTLGDYGLAIETTGERLARFLAVQNTYLLTFQSLGGLGLLLGTFGLATVQLRNVLERRGELALLRATGFRRATLGEIVLLENGLLLAAGLVSGVLAALVAVLPHLFGRGASIPWAPLAGTLALVVVVGLVAGVAAVRAALTAPLLTTLRDEH